MAAYEGDDIYCDLILPGHLPVEVIVDRPDVLAFHHTRPYWPVHVVVIPKRHVDSLLAPDAPEVLPALFDVVREVAAQVEADHGACRVLTNLGKYQDSKHLHVHVSSGDPLR